MPLQSLTLWAMSNEVRAKNKVAESVEVMMINFAFLCAFARNGLLAMNKVAESVEVMMINFAFLCAFARNGLLAMNKVAEPELWGRDLSRP